MHGLSLLILSILVTACNHDGNSSHHRSYVISKSNETIEELEPPLEPIDR